MLCLMTVMNRLSSWSWPFALVFAVGLAAAPAHCQEPAAKRVLFFGDSITAWYDPTDWPALVGKRRPTLQICRNGVPGRTTLDGRDSFDGVMAYTQYYGRVTDVVILLGINDLLLGSDPHDTAVRLRELGQRAREWGAREWILTLTPALKIPLRRDLPAWEFSRDVGNWLLRLNGIGPAYNIIDVRDEFARRVLWSSCSSDGLHPTGIGCRQVIADAVANALP